MWLYVHVGFGKVFFGAVVVAVGISGVILSRRTGFGATRFERFELTDNFHFFTELAQHIIRATGYLGPTGRLYQVDMRLRPTGKSGSLVIPLPEFRRYHEGGDQDITSDDKKAA